LTEGTVAREYLKRYKQKLNREQIAFIEAMLQSYYSFYEILEVEPEKSILLEDVLLGTKHRIKEKLGTRTFNRGERIFSRILSLGEGAILIGMSPWIVSTSHISIEGFKDSLKTKVKKITPEFLRGEGHEEVLTCFFMILEDIFYSKPPKIHNTDGDPIRMTKVYFKTELNPREVLKVLGPMTLHEEFEDAEKKKDKKRKTIKVEFPWLKRGNKMNVHWKTTILGHFTVIPGKVTLEVNSQKRAETGRKLVEKYGKGKIMFEGTEIEAEGQKKFQKKLSPEVQEQVKDITKSHWDYWFDHPISMLDLQTPREAMKTKEGRQKLEALLVYYEKQNKNSPANFLRMDVEYLRNGLGLRKR